MKRDVCNENIRQLLDENLKLLLEILKHKVAKCKGTCITCNVPLEPLGLRNEWPKLIDENARLKQEINRVIQVAKVCFGEHIPQATQYLPGLLESLGMRTEIHLPELFELMTSSMQEVMKLAVLGEPLWISHPQECSETLNENEYVLNFPSSIIPKPLWYTCEGTRARATIKIMPTGLVGLLMDVNLWAACFSSMVASGVVVEKLSTGVPNTYDGTILVVSAEYQTPEPGIPHRRSVFLRYCKKQEGEAWSVVDVSLDNVQQTPIMKCRRRPSGCLIQETYNGFSDVIWVEHFESDNRSVTEEYESFVNSGLAFGAEQWVYILERQCKNARDQMGWNIPKRGTPLYIGKGKKQLKCISPKKWRGDCQGSEKARGDAN